MINGIITVVILSIIGSAIGYIAKEKKKGSKCIGCALASQCGSKPKDACGNKIK